MHHRQQPGAVGRAEAVTGEQVREGSVGPAEGELEQTQDAGPVGLDRAGARPSCALERGRHQTAAFVLVAEDGVEAREGHEQKVSSVAWPVSLASWTDSDAAA